jgi:hypothetical protein
VPVPRAIECSDLESFRQALYEPSGVQVDTSCKDVGLLQCSWCGIWQPIEHRDVFITANSRADEPVGFVTDSSCGVALSGDNSEQVDDLVWPHAEVIPAPGWQFAETTLANNGGTGDVAQHESPFSAGPEAHFVQMPVIDLLNVREVGALVSCSWWHAELLQPYLCLLIEFNGGQATTFRPQ